jgi:hypothetical protein
MRAASARNTAAGQGALPPPAGVTVNANAEDGSWFVAVRAPQTLPQPALVNRPSLSN